MPFPALHTTMARVLQRVPLTAWSRGRAPRAVTAVMMGARCLAVRAEAGAPGEAPVLVAVAEGDAADLAAWRREGLFQGGRALLVLRPADRHYMAMDRPEVPDGELSMAVRWPLGAALELEPDQLLTTAVPMPRINDTVRDQVLAVAAPVQTVRDHVATLAAAGIDVRSIDVTESALRGMRLLLPPDADGWVVLAFVGDDVCIGLLWHGQFCALRTLALPPRLTSDDASFHEQLALQIQRTMDQFERQATQLAIRHVLVSMPTLTPGGRRAMRDALPVSAHWFDLSAAFRVEPELALRFNAHDDLCALACVAAARLADLTLVPALGAAGAPS